jgi:hypothetical protein
MTDFVTRLETELHEAAMRRERAGVVRGVALPRARLVLGDLPMAVLASVLLGLVLAGAAMLLTSSSQRAAQGTLPPALRGIWRAGPTELRLYPNAAVRCVNLGLGSSDPCYTIGSSQNGVAQEWGELSVGGDQLMLRPTSGGEPSSYRWRVEGRALRLATVSDGRAARARALTSQPFIHARVRHATPRIPANWTARGFASESHGYWIRYPSDWTARPASAPGKADRLSPASAGAALPVVTIAVQRLPAGTSQGRWSVIVNSRPEAGGCAPAWYRKRSADGEPAMITRYLACHGADEQWASFVHNGRGYMAVWRGKVGRTAADGPLFDAMLRSITFVG